MQPGSQDASEKLRGRASDGIVDAPGFGRRLRGRSLRGNRSFEFRGVCLEFEPGLLETRFNWIGIGHM